MQTLEQKRAHAAWKSTPKQLGKEYLSLVRGAAADILTAGLGQSLAFYLSKNKQHHRDLLNNLAAWLLRERPEKGQRQPVHLMQAVMNGSSDDYRRLRTEALAYLPWLKRFAEAKDGLSKSSSASDTPPQAPAAAAGGAS